jgi:iron complex outermembrane receptor protein
MINLSIGAHGFAGFSPEQSGYWGRSNYAFYTDIEADLTDAFTAGVALRYEDFESFGDTTNFKVQGRYRLTDDLSVRASYNTGFRAPTPGQENVTKLSTITVDGELQQRGQIHQQIQLRIPWCVCP